MSKLYDGSTIAQGGRVFRVNLEYDRDHGAPWEDDCGHGVIVEDYEHNKRAGWRKLGTTGTRDVWRFYDIPGSIKLATRDGWGINTNELEALTCKLGRSPTRREIVARAVDLDFEFLQGWVDDRWYYIGVIVTDVTDSDDPEDCETDYRYALWGVESCCEAHIVEVAQELVTEQLVDLEKRREHARTTVHTVNKQALELIAEIKAANKRFTPAICDALRYRLGELLNAKRAAYTALGQG